MMTLAPSEITKLESKAKSLLESGLDLNNAKDEMEKRVKQALACLDTIIRNAPVDTRYLYAVQHAEMLFRAISWDYGVIPWKDFIPCDSSITVLSDEETRKLAEIGFRILREKTGSEGKRALCYFDTIIKFSAPKAYYFSFRGDCRALCYDALGAVEDYSRAIALDPDQPQYYKIRSLYKAARISSEKTPLESITELLGDYKTAMQQDPTAPDVWLPLMYLTLMLDDWDEVISLCGQSQPFITNPNIKAKRAWILGLALTLAGDPVAEGDMQPLREARIIYTTFDRSFIEKIISHIADLSKDKKLPEKTQRSVDDLNELLLSRLDEQMFSSRMYKSLGLWEKALKSVELLLKQRPDDNEGWVDKCNILIKMGRFDDALMAYRHSDMGKSRETEKSLLRGWISKLLGQGQVEELLNVFVRNCDRCDFLSDYFLYEDIDAILRIKPSKVRNLTILDEIEKKADSKDDQILSVVSYLKARIYAFCEEQENARDCLAKAVELDTKFSHLASKDTLLKDLYPDDTQKSRPTQKLDLFHRMRSWFSPPDK